MLEVVSRSYIPKKLWKTYGDYKIYIVNGQQVRSLSSEAANFTNFALHSDFSFVPHNEIWIDKNTSREEKFFDIENAIHQLDMQRKGKSRKEAYQAGINYEKSLREKAHNVQHNPEGVNEPPPRQVYVKPYGEMPDNIKVWLVNGEFVRDAFKTDFVMGGHGYVYHWIPNDEIWIESTESPDEMPSILLHEFVERTLMKYQHVYYDNAHDIATKVEFKNRNKRLNPQKILKLTKDDAVKLAKMYN